MLRAAESTHGDLWAKAAELERDFAGYKRRLAERRACAAGDGCAGGGDKEEGDEEEQGAGEGSGRGRRYEEYVRRRDERLRHEWRARMERKEAEMKQLWARLDRTRSSRGRRGGDVGELVASSHDREDHVHRKPGTLEVKVKLKPTAPVTPRSSPATKLSRPRTSVPSSPAAASPRRRRPPHQHLQQAEPPATPRKENRLPPPSAAVAAAPVTPRPLTALPRSRSMVNNNKDRSCFSGRESPRPPRFQPPRTSCDGASNVKDALLSPDYHDAIAIEQSRLCFSDHASVLAHFKKACAVAPEPFHLARAGGVGAEAASYSLVASKDAEPACSEIAPAGCNADSKCNNDRNHDQSAAKSGSPDITGDSDTEPSYVYIKRDNGEETSQVSSVGLGTRPQAELLSEDKGNCDLEGTMAPSDATNAIAGESPVSEAEEESRRLSSESLYSIVRSSFSQRSEHDASAPGSPLCSTPLTDPSPVEDAARPRKNRAEEEAEKDLRIPTSPGSSVTVSITVQSPMDAMAGLRRLLTFGKKNAKTEVATTVLERTPRSLAPAPPACDCSTSKGWTIGDSIKGRSGFSDSNAVASDNPENSSVISPHVRSLQSFTQSSPGNHEMKEAKSPRVNRSFFSLPSFKSRAS